MTSENHPDSTAGNQEERDAQADRDISARWLRNLADRIDKGEVRSLFCVFVESDGMVYRDMMSTFCPVGEDAREAALLYVWGKKAMKRAFNAISGDRPLPTSGVES